MLLNFHSWGRPKIYASSQQTKAWFHQNSLWGINEFIGSSNGDLVESYLLECGHSSLNLPGLKSIIQHQWGFPYICNYTLTSPRLHAVDSGGYQVRGFYLIPPLAVGLYSSNTCNWDDLLWRVAQQLPKMVLVGRQLIACFIPYSDIVFFQHFLPSTIVPECQKGFLHLQNMVVGESCWYFSYYTTQGREWTPPNVSDPNGQRLK